VISITLEDLHLQLGVKMKKVDGSWHRAERVVRIGIIVGVVIPTP
jgi:hypothetical protein